MIFLWKDDYISDTVFDIPFIAPYQVMNAALAVKTIEVLEDQIPVSLEGSCRLELQKHAGREEWKRFFRV